MASEVTETIPAEPTAEKDSIASVSGHISVLTTGDHALLRRMYLTRSPAADGVVVKLLVYAGLDRRYYGPNFAAWKLVVHVAALLSGTGKTQPHSYKRDLGRALHEAGLSENRLLRLLATRASALEDQVVLAARMLAQKGQGPVNLRTLLQLLSDKPDRAERARVRIASDYYAAKAASN